MTGRATSNRVRRFLRWWKRGFYHYWLQWFKVVPMPAKWKSVGAEWLIRRFEEPKR